jgi:hypothetical protein
MSVLRSSVWMSSDAGESWSWQESTAAFGARSGAAAVLTSGSFLLLGGVSKGTVFNDIYRADLPQGNPNADGGVVAGILGASAGLMLIVLILRHCINHIRAQPWRRREKAAAELAAATAASQGAHVLLDETGAPEH